MVWGLIGWVCLCVCLGSPQGVTLMGTLDAVVKQLGDAQKGESRGAHGHCWLGHSVPLWALLVS